MIIADLPKSYTPTDHEADVRAKWEQSRCFHTVPDPSRRPYSIVIPPPNVTAALHLGHALNNTLQDVLTRYHRMAGFNTLWMPGTDHAGIATQTVVDKRLQTEGKPSLRDYKKLETAGEDGRGQFIAQIQSWKDEYEATISEQLKLMGCSCDYDRQRFTMDEMCAKAVREAFFQLFRDGLIYRGKRLVNWDPVSQTALADDEVEMEEVHGHMHYLRYPLVDDPNEFIVVATTRPETMLGDTAVAINPKDPRAEKYIGRKVKLPIVGREIPIIADDYVVRPAEFGGDPNDAKAKIATGFLKVTPAHDPNDYDIGQRHNLEMVNIFAPDATISDQYGWTDFATSRDREGADSAFIQALLGVSREDARRQILEWFKGKGLLDKIVDYTHSVGHSYRSHVPIEPYLSDQWYVRVTDDRLRGEALRAMNPEQISNDNPTSRDREGAVATIARPSDESQHLNPSAFLISFTCYGTWLHGDERGSIDRIHNLPETPVLSGDENRERLEFESLKQRPMTLDENARRVVQETIQGVCEHRGWRLIALNVRTNHLHVVVIADTSPERVMNDFKAYATRRLRELGFIEQNQRVWTRHGSTRYLNDDASVQAAATYVVEGQGSALLPQPIDWRERGTQPLPHGRGSFTFAGDGELTFYPARYAKTFQQWHENIRDWCISRQIWWGHRIPVWSIKSQTQLPSTSEFAEWVLAKIEKGEIASRHRDADESERNFRRGDSLHDFFYCFRSEPSEDDRAVLSNAGFTQDPDVLDTWFSSGLWPLSTMGWPDPSAYPETEGLLEQFNPTSVLCTAREIITLWVSRMVMFNRYFREGTLPFNDVFIHAMIQDGHGQKMSKSLGNGVDPRDIIHSHGADAMRYALVQMTTQTQDVRMPVDLVCPHCEHAFTPKEITSGGGYTVAAPEQTCPKCSKGMVSAFGVATGQVKATNDAPVARNTSPRFDLGRNFCNKLWNATRFALNNLNQPTQAHGQQSVGLDDLSITDKWMLARLHRALHTVEDSLKEYQFSVYANTMYDLIWGDFCDWYLEAIKPTIKTDPAQQQVLRTVLNAIVRLLHPIMPFVTEALWPHVQAAGPAGLPGVNLPSNDILAIADWPDIACSIDDKHAHDEFERAQQLVLAIRNVRGEHKVPPKKKITLHATDAVRALIERTGPVIPALAELEAVESIPAERPKNAVTLLINSEEQLLTGVLAEANSAAEIDRLKKELAELEKKRKALEARLANPGYTEKAPPALVQQTTDDLTKTIAEIAVKTDMLSGPPTD